MTLKVMLTGLNGQLGALLKEQAPSVVQLFAYSSAELDITDAEKIRDTIGDVQPDLIINAAAYTKVDLAEDEKEKAYAVNAEGPGLLAELSSSACRVIHVSTDFVFDGRSDQPYLVEDEPCPIGVYGASKLEGERRVLAAKPGCSTVIRTAWVYAAEGKNFVDTMLMLMGSKDELSVVSDQIGTPTSAHTLAKLIWIIAMKEESYGLLHWTDQGKTSWYDFAVSIQKQALALGLLKRSIPINPVGTDQFPTKAERPKYSVLDKSKVYSLLGFDGMHWEQELENVLKRRTS